MIYTTKSVLCISWILISRLTDFSGPLNSHNVLLFILASANVIYDIGSQYVGFQGKKRNGGRADSILSLRNFRFAKWLRNLIRPRDDIFSLTT